MKLLISTSGYTSPTDSYAKAIKSIDAKFKPQIKQATADLAAAKKAAAEGRKALEKVVADAEAALKTAQAALKTAQGALAKYDTKAGVTKLEKRLATLKDQHWSQTVKLRGK